MPDDKLSAALEEIRERGYENGAHGAQAARLSDSAAIDAPRLLGALDAVLALHQRYEGSPGPVCGYCVDSYGEHEEWPCGTVQVITRALAVEVEKSHD